jgi:hypothetical protein
MTRIGQLAEKGGTLYAIRYESFGLIASGDREE